MISNKNDCAHATSFTCSTFDRRLFATKFVDITVHKIFVQILHVVRVASNIISRVRSDFRYNYKRGKSGPVQ